MKMSTAIDNVNEDEDKIFIMLVFLRLTEITPETKPYNFYIHTEKTLHVEYRLYELDWYNSTPGSTLKQRSDRIFLELLIDYNVESKQVAATLDVQRHDGLGIRRYIVTNVNKEPTDTLVSIKLHEFLLSKIAELTPVIPLLTLELGT